MHTTLHFWLGEALKHPGWFATRPIDNREKGFTLIELLVVTIIIGILATVAVPVIFSQVYRAQAAGAKVHLGSLIRAQQAYRFTNDMFAGSIPELETGAPFETKFHTYGVAESEANWTFIEATPRGEFVRGFVGVAYIDGDTIQTTVCEGAPGIVPTVTVSQTASGAVISGCDSLL